MAQPKHKIFRNFNGDPLGDFEGEAPRVGDFVTIHESGRSGNVIRVSWHIESGKSWAEIHLGD